MFYPNMDECMNEMKLGPDDSKSLHLSDEFTDFQRYRVPELQSYTVSELQKVRVTQLSICTVAELHS